MKKFKIKKYNKKNKFVVLVFFVFVFNIIFFSFYGNKLSDNVFKIVKVRVEEISKYYMNKVIKKYLNIDTNNYIKLNIVNNNIVSVDIDNVKSNELLKIIIDDLEKVVIDIQKGNIDYLSNLNYINNDNYFILLVPLGSAYNNSLLYDLGPKIPVKVNFLENVDAYLDVNVLEYGINNALVKLFINITMEQAIQMPIDSEKIKVEYRFLIASKLVNGVVPSLYGYGINANSNLVKTSVN